MIKVEDAIAVFASDHQAYKKLEAERDCLRAENAKLREALEKCRSIVLDEMCQATPKLARSDIYQIARAALEGKDE
jgi:cell division protein FtsB